MTEPQPTTSQAEETGEEQDSTEVTEEQVSEETTEEQSTEESAEEEGESFSREYVEKLRKEAAANRKKLKEYEDRDKSEAQKVTEERDRLHAENETLRQSQRRSAFLESIQLPSPKLAWNSLSDAGIELKYDDAGRPQKQSLDAARKALKEYDPEVFGEGSADGGSSSSGDQPTSMNDMIRRSAGR